MKIYTRRGDKGQTDLFGGERVAKDHTRVAAYGEVDELNAHIGLARAHSVAADLEDLLAGIQSALFDLGAYLATPDPAHRKKAAIASLESRDVEILEAAIDRLEEELEPLKSFILPGGTPAAAAFHVARTACRRTERGLVALDRDDPLDEVALRYVNRLSDLLFTLARVENRRAGVADVEWVRRQV